MRWNWILGTSHDVKVDVLLMFLQSMGWRRLVTSRKDAQVNQRLVSGNVLG